MCVSPSTWLFVAFLGLLVVRSGTAADTAPAAQIQTAQAAAPQTVAPPAVAENATTDRVLIVYNGFDHFTALKQRDMATTPRLHTASGDRVGCVRGVLQALRACVSVERVRTDPGLQCHCGACHPDAETCASAVEVAASAMSSGEHLDQDDLKKLWWAPKDTSARVV